MKGGRKSWIQKNDSYYSGGGDKASVTTETIQSALKELRKNIKGVSEENTESEVEKKKYYKYFIIGATFIAIGSGIAYYFLIYKKK
jgi:coproporphyrinogen III oxidase-like Fe-S oxidoreductase